MSLKFDVLDPAMAKIMVKGEVAVDLVERLG